LNLQVEFAIKFAIILHGTNRLVNLKQFPHYCLLRGITIHKILLQYLHRGVKPGEFQAKQKIVVYSKAQKPPPLDPQPISHLSKIGNSNLKPQTSNPAGETFTRRTASTSIPATNPFLKRLFNTVVEKEIVFDKEKNE
jgi:hypothetical protein